MAPSRSGAFSPTLSSAASHSGSGTSRLNIVSRLVIEGKVKHNVDAASIKLYLKINIPADSVSPGQIIPIFAEENVKIRDYSVHPLDTDSAPYNFSSTSHPLLHNAARALNLPARSSKSYLSLFDATPQNTPGRNGSVNGSTVPTLEERYTGYFLISGYNVCYVLPKEFPAKFKTRGGTDSEGEVLSARSAPRTSYRSGSSARRHSVGERNSMQFMAGLSLWVPFSLKPPKAPYMLSIPIPRCLSNNIKVRLPPPSSVSTSFASLESDEDSNGWDLATEPHVACASSKHIGRTSAYTEFADDESSEASMTGGLLENCMVQGTFTSSDAIRIRWATPLRTQDFPDGRRRVGVEEVAGNMTCTVLETRADGVKMRLDYQGTCAGVWFPGVATMLGMDMGLDTQGARVTWPPDSDGQWTIDGDPALTGFTAGLPQTVLSPKPSLELPQPDESAVLGDGAPNGLMHRPSDTSTSLLRAPLPNRRSSVEYSFEDSLNATSVPSIASSAIRSSGPDSASESSARPPTTPITVHINMNELAPTKNKLTVNISGTVLIASGPGTQNIIDNGQTTLPLPQFRVFSAEKEDVITTIRNQCDSASVELINSGMESSGRGRNGYSPIYNQSLSLSGSKAKRTVVPAGTQAKCASVEGSEILVKPIPPKASVRGQEVSPRLLGHSVGRAAASQPNSPEPTCAILRPQGTRSMSIRDGPLMIPWVNAELVPLISTAPHANLSRNAPGKLTDRWSYAVTVSLPTPVEGSSEWLEFGLALSPEANASGLTYAVEMSCASVNGVPVRCEALANPRAISVDLSASTSSVGAGSTETIGAAGGSPGKQTWLSWVRVHVSLTGALEVVYKVKEQSVRDTLDKKGKKKAISSMRDNVHVLVPIFSIPVSRYEISLRRSSDITVPEPGPGDTNASDYTLQRKIYAYDVQAFSHAHADLIMPRPKPASNSKPSQARRNVVRILSAFITILPYILSLIVLIHAVNMRQEIRELHTFIPETWVGSSTSPEQARRWIRKKESVTVTSTLTQSGSTPTSSSERRWFGDTYTMSYSSPTQKAKVLPPRPSSSIRRGTVDDDEAVIEDVPGHESDDGNGHPAEDSSLLPVLHVPFILPAQFHFEQAKAQWVSGWNRIWRVVEIILHWPLPVDDS